MKFKSLVFSFILTALSLSGALAADEYPAGTAPSSSELVRLSWKASNDNNMDALTKYYDEIISLYQVKAQLQAQELTGFPYRDKVEDYRIMNDVATAMFIKAEALMHQGVNDQAKALFQDVGQKFPWSQAWDPSRGAYWSIKEKSEASIKVIEGGAQEDKAARRGPKTVPHLEFPGTEPIIDYKKYGNFLNAGTPEYHYQITDPTGLVAAAGEAIYPNQSDLYKDPNYKEALKSGRLEGSHWDFVNTEDLEAAIYKWATAPEPWGVRLFYMGIIYEKAKMYHQAIKAYHTIIVFFPNTIAWTYWQTPWYPGQAAVAKIEHIIRMHPELNLKLRNAKIQIKNAFDNDAHNDITIASPGEIRQFPSALVKEDKPKEELGQPVKTLGSGKVQLVKYANGHWQLLKDGKPYLIKGITYGPSKVGQSPDKGTLTNWMEMDENKNGLIDSPYEAWMDKNNDGEQGDDEPSVGDFALMKEMGVNTIRFYHHPLKPNKALFQKMHKDYGMMLIMGDFLGKYAIGSGAAWSEGTDYENPEHQKAMMETVKDMVMEYKDEPYILMWMLGNENNYGVASNADKKPDVYYKFVNDVATMIKEIDPNHPVAICNGDTLYLDKVAALAPEIDAYGANVYRGDYGFGSFWQQVSESLDRPAFISEYGAPSFGGPGLSYEEAKDAQASYHKGNWLDIYYNSAGFEDGTGNAIGAVAFEWVDEWWKNYEPSVHDTKADVVGPFPGGYYYEEWFGLLGQGQGRKSPYLREPRKVYYTYKDLWN
jgi:tetratricopeptide (TPR) repeat protein